MIIHKTTYQVQEISSHPNDNWMGDDWTVVPESLHAKAWEFAPYCELVFEDDELVDITDNGQRPPEPEREPGSDELLNIMLGVQDDE